MKMISEPKKMQKAILPHEKTGQSKDLKGSRAQDSTNELAVSNQKLVGALSVSVADKKDLYDEMEPFSLSRVDHQFHEGMNGYRPSVKEDMEEDVPRQFFGLSTRKGDFSVGKKRGSDELIMTSSIKNTKGQSITSNAQQAIDASHKSMTPGRLKIMRSNTPVKDEAMAIFEKERVFSAERLGLRISDLMTREKRVGSLEKTVPFLNQEKESASILTLRERRMQLQERQKQLNARRNSGASEGLDEQEKAIFSEKRVIEEMLEKCQAVLSSKQQMKNRFMKSFTKAMKTANDETIDRELETQKSAWRAVYQNEEFDDAEDEDEADRGILKKGKTNRKGANSGAMTKRGETVHEET